MSKPSLERNTKILVSVVVKLVASAVGGAVGWGISGWLSYYLVYWVTNGWEAEHGVTTLVGLGLGFLVGTPIGGAVGVAIVLKVLRQKGSFWKALLGAISGLVVGGLLSLCLLQLSNSFGMDWWNQDTEVYVAPVIPFAATVLGAVIGSGWNIER